MRVGRVGFFVVFVTFMPSTAAWAQVPVSRTRYELPVSNGHGALIVHLDDADPSRARRATHFREHLFAVEEPALDANGNEVWGGFDFNAIYTRDLLYDAYFGLRSGGTQRWLPDVPADLDRSGYADAQPGARGGTGVVELVQPVGGVEATQFFFAPMELEANGFVMAIRVENVSDEPQPNVSAFSLANFHLGYGRAQTPWDVGEDIDNNDETLTHVFDGQGDAFVEQGFAGTLVMRAVGDVAHFGSAPGAAIFNVVANGGTSNLPDNEPSGMAESGAVGSFQFDFGTLAPGETRWAALAMLHHGDPQLGAALLGQIDSYVNGRSAQALIEDEVAGWRAFQDTVTMPPQAGADEQEVVRQSAAMLRMGQVREREMYLRESASRPGEIRRSRFADQLPATVQHNGYGAILASLPPGNWTYAWIRDGAYAIKAMAQLGMQTQARDALAFYLNAEAGRFQNWSELDGYGMPPYQISLVRYYGFGIEETDFNAFGPNLEFDGFGLFLWALRAYEHATGDTTLTDDNWPLIDQQVAQPLIALTEPTTGLLRADSSIWETHWYGRERHWAYTNLTAIRGLCDASEMAARNGDPDRALRLRDAALDLREAFAARLTDADGAIASNLEELQRGEGYFDAAVLDAIAMGLFDPQGEIATATLQKLDAALLVEASGVGWSRNDDRFDHPNATDISPWGSDYDSAEWVITDLRGAIAKRDAGDSDRSDAILDWITEQSRANYLMVAETFEETTGEYKFNAPMLGFGAGAYSLALFHRDGLNVSPACGFYYEDEDPGFDPGSGSSSGSGPDSGASSDSGEDPAPDAPGSTSTSAGNGGDAPRPGSNANPPGVNISESASGGSEGDELGPNQDGAGSGCAVHASPRSNAGALAFIALFAAVRRRRQS